MNDKPRNKIIIPTINVSNMRFFLLICLKPNLVCKDRFFLSKIIPILINNKIIPEIKKNSYSIVDSFYLIIILINPTKIVPIPNNRKHKPRININLSVCFIPSNIEFPKKQDDDLNTSFAFFLYCKICIRPIKLKNIPENTKYSPYSISNQQIYP